MQNKTQITIAIPDNAIDIWRISCDWNSTPINHLISNLSNHLYNVKDKAFYFDIVEFKIFRKWKNWPHIAVKLQSFMTHTATFNIYPFQVKFNEQVKHYVYWMSRKMMILKEFCTTEEICNISILGLVGLMLLT